MPNTIVVAPTTAVPISTGLAVALKVLPAPSPFSSWYLAFSKSASKPKSRLISPLMSLRALDLAQFIDRLRVVRDRAVAVHGDGDGSHAQESEGHQTEGKNRRRKREFLRQEMLQRRTPGEVVARRPSGP